MASSRWRPRKSGQRLVGDEDLGVGDLPEQEVRDALLARGADDEVGVGHVRGIEMRAESLLVDAGFDAIDLQQVFKRDAAAVGFFDHAGDERAAGVDDLCAAAVVECEGKRGAGVFRGLLGRPLHGVLDLLGEPAGLADVAHAHVVVVHALDVADEVALEQRHQEADFGLGAAQVIFQREGVERDPRQVDAGCGLDDVLDGFSALLVAEEALERALAGPAAVAVHDDGDVIRNARGIELSVHGGLLGREFTEAGGGPAGAVEWEVW